MAATHNIYVANMTEWTGGVALYAWGDSEVFGGWPGAYAIDRDLYFVLTPEGGNAGVELIGADDNAQVEYYNLQGVRVSNPENGIFICRKGANVTKIVK